MDKLHGFCILHDSIILMSNIIYKKWDDNCQYSAGSDGNIYNDDYYETGNRKVVSTFTEKGFLRFNMKQGDKSSSKSVHICVALAFLGVPPFEKYKIQHIDHDKSNNAPSNLMYVSTKDVFSYFTCIECGIKFQSKTVKDICSLACRNKNREKELAHLKEREEIIIFREKLAEREYNVIAKEYENMQFKKEVLIMKETLGWSRVQEPSTWNGQ